LAKSSVAYNVEHLICFGHCKEYIAFDLNILKSLSKNFKLLFLFLGEEIWYLLFHIPLVNFTLPRKLPGKN